MLHSPSMNRPSLAVFFAVLVLAASVATSRAEEGAFGELAYRPSDPAFAGLVKQSAVLRSRLAAAPDDETRARAAASFVSYLDGVASKLESSGKAEYAAEVRAYGERVRVWREDLLAAAESDGGNGDPFADGGAADPFASGSSDDPFAPGATAPPSAVKSRAYDPDDPFAAPPPAEKKPETPPAEKKPAYDPDDPFAAPPPAKPAPAEAPPKPAVAAGGDAPEPANPYAPDPLDELPPERATPADAGKAGSAPPAAPAPAAPVRPPVAAGGGWLSDPTPIEIDSTMPGIVVGPFEEGDLLVLRYKSGEWTSEENRRFKVRPDVPRVDPRERLVLVRGEDVQEVPGQTDAAPFVYTVEDGEGIRLRIGEDPGQDHEHLVDNAGSVVYLAYVIGADEAEAFRASSEGRRCQFAKTAAERRAEEEAAAEKTGDPFTFVTTKQDGECEFDFTQNGGRFTIKASGTEFGTHWSRGPSDDIVFADATYVRKIGGKQGFKRLPNSTKGFDDLVFAPGSRTVHKGEVVVFLNAEGRMLAVRVDGVRLPNAATGSPGKLSIHWRLY